MGGRWLHGGLGVAVAGQALHVEVVRRQGVPVVGVLHAGRVREALGERGLLAQRLRQRSVRQRSARVQPLPECVHHADLRRAHRFSPVRLPRSDTRPALAVVADANRRSRTQLPSF